MRFVAIIDQILMAGDNLYVTQDRISVKFDTLESGPALFAFEFKEKPET